MIKYREGRVTSGRRENLLLVLRKVSRCTQMCTSVWMQANWMDCPVIPVTGVYANLLHSHPEEGVTSKSCITSHSIVMNLIIRIMNHQIKEGGCGVGGEGMDRKRRKTFHNHIITEELSL